MSQHLDKLLHKTYKLIPQFSKSLEKIPSNNMFLNYPLDLVSQKSKSVFPNYTTFLKSQKSIRSNNHIFVVQSSEFFSSSNFSGATSSEQIQLNKKLEELKKKYQIFDDDMINRIKLTLSVQANFFDDYMHLNTYAKYVLKQKKNPSIENYIKMHANSGFLKSILNSNKIAVTTAYDCLNKSFLKTVKFDDFSNAYELVRFYSKETNNLRVIFPFCNNIKHSFEPNCELKAMFLTHRRETFLSVDSIKEIGPGEQLTINYGNQNNYELFVRYGFVIPNNPFGEFYLPLDFSQIQDIFNENIEWKMDMFKKNKKLKLKNFVRINVKGQINSDDFNMLKIVFATSPLTRESFNSENEQTKQLQIKIKDFTKKTAERFSVMMQRMIQKRKEVMKEQIKAPQNETQKIILENVQIIENQEKQILQRLVKRNQNC